MHRVNHRFIADHGVNLDCHVAGPSGQPVRDVPQAFTNRELIAALVHDVRERDDPDRRPSVRPLEGAIERD